MEIPKSIIMPIHVHFIIYETDERTKHTLCPYKKSGNHVTTPTSAMNTNIAEYGHINTNPLKRREDCYYTADARGSS